jgi:hypothetical protein
MRRLRYGRAKTSWFFRFLSEKGFWALDRAWKFRRGTRIRTNSRKSRTASIPAALDFRTPPRDRCLGEHVWVDAHAPYALDDRILDQGCGHRA